MKYIIELRIEAFHSRPLEIKVFYVFMFYDTYVIDTIFLFCY